MIRNIISFVVLVLIAYGVWYYVDREEAKKYLPDYFSEEKMDQIVDGVGDFVVGTWEAIKDFFIEHVWNNIRNDVGDTVGDSVADMIKGDEAVEAN